MPSLHRDVSQEQFERTDTGPDHDGTKRFAAALGVGRNAKISVAVSFVLSAMLYGVFVLAPGETAHHSLLYAALAAVIWFALALTFTLVLTAYSAWKLVREDNDP